MILSTWTTLESVKHIVLSGQMGAFMDIAGVIACIMAGCAVIKIVMNYNEGHNLNAWEIGKPLILMMVVCNFNVLVLGPVDGVVNIISREMVKLMNVKPNKYVDRWSDAMTTITILNVLDNESEYMEELEEIAEKDSVVGRFFAKIWYGIMKFLKNFFSVKTMTFAGIIGGILFMFVKVLLFAQQILCCLYMTVNAVFGPFILAISIMPGFEGGLRSWFARYLQIAMWVPIGYFMLGLSLLYIEGFCKLSMQGEVGLGIEWTMIVLQACSLAGVAAVPKIAGSFIESTGANDAHSSITNPMKMMARRFIKM